MMSAEAPGLGRRTGAGIIWAGGGRLFRAVIQFVFILLLARALLPSEFATGVIILLAHQLSTTLSTQSLHQALVQGGDWSEDTQSTAFWLNTGLCLGTFIVIAGSGIPAAHAFRLPALVWMLPAVSLGALIAIPAILPTALMTATMAFKRLSIVESVASGVSGALSIAALHAGFGLWSLILYCLSQRVLEVLGLILSRPWRPVRAFNLPASRRLAQYAFPLVGVQIVQFLANSIDQIFVGRVIGAEALGFYGFARRISQQPAQMMAYAVERVSFPALVQAGATKSRLDFYYTHLVRVVALVSFTAFLGAAIFSPPLIALLLGDTWKEAAPILVAFFVAATLIPIGPLFGALMRASGKTYLQFGFAIFRLAVLALVLLVAAILHAKADSLAWVLVVSSALTLIPNAFVAHRAAGLDTYGFAVALLRGATPAILASLVALVCLNWGATSQAEIPARDWWCALLVAAAAWGVSAVCLNLDFGRTIVRTYIK